MPARVAMSLLPKATEAHAVTCPWRDDLPGSSFMADRAVSTNWAGPFLGGPDNKNPTVSASSGGELKQRPTVDGRKLFYFPTCSQELDGKSTQAERTSSYESSSAGLALKAHSKFPETL